MKGELLVYTGLPGSGKTTALIQEMKRLQSVGKPVVLFLSSEHPELTRRRNVRRGGLMGSRTPGLRFPIDHVTTTGDATKILQELSAETTAVFDEAQFFRPEIVDAWRVAANRGLRILVGSPSPGQIQALSESEARVEVLSVECALCGRTASRVTYLTSLIHPEHRCEPCFRAEFTSRLDELLDEVLIAEPFPGEKRTYQPFHGVDMPGWKVVRPDSQARLDILLEAIGRVPTSGPQSGIPAVSTYLDLGSCMGFFCDAMTARGFRSTGVDVTPRFIDWAKRVALLKGQSIEYHAEDAAAFLGRTQGVYDVTSSFATIQWVMAQKGYEVGVGCLEQLFRKTKRVCILELGYSAEDAYREKLAGMPEPIDREWVVRTMSKLGGFASVEVQPAGSNGIWRDLFVGFKEAPGHRPFRVDFDSPTIEQETATDGLWEDRWVASRLETRLRAKRSLEKMMLSGWLPQDVGEQQLTVKMDGDELGQFKVGSGSFECEFPFQMAAGRSFALEILSSGEFRPKDDQRRLAFVLTDLRFSS